MTLKSLQKKLDKVCNNYSNKFNIAITDDWFLMKIQEELGELVSCHLQLTGRGRIKGKSKKDLNKNFSEEIVDVLAMTLLLAAHKNIDLDKALKNKWFKYLKD